VQLVLLGPPGAGKGTQAKLITERYHLLHLSTGDVLRRNIAEGTALGHRAKPFIESGQYVPDELINRMVESEIMAPAAKEGVVFDGYPRTLNQAESLDTLLEEHKKPIDAVISLEVQSEEVISRLAGRRVCTGCGALYHLVSLPPLKPDVCDHCGSWLYQRADDNEQTIRTRLEVYCTQTEPLLDYYRKQRKLRTVDAARGIERTFERVVQLLGGDL
jgi:adenylate kinase